MTTPVGFPLISILDAKIEMSEEKLSLATIVPKIQPFPPSHEKWHDNHYCNVEWQPPSLLSSLCLPMQTTIEINEFTKSSFSAAFKVTFALNLKLIKQFAPLKILNIQFLDMVVRVASWMTWWLRQIVTETDHSVAGTLTLTTKPMIAEGCCPARLLWGSLSVLE